MKKIAKTILAVICFSAVILAGAENPDGSCNLAWTIGCLGIALASGAGLKRMEEAE